MAIRKIDEYIEQFPTETQKVLENIRRAIHESGPELEEAMAYGIPTFRSKGKNLVHFAGFEKHVGFYPAPSGIAAFEEEIKNYKWAKGSVQFPLGEPIPYELIKKITKFRVREVDNG